jgi:hypothetical protein
MKTPTGGIDQPFFKKATSLRHAATAAARITS